MNHLILINQTHSYPVSIQQDMVIIHPDFPDILLEREAVQALARLMAEIDGWQHIVPVSGWRSFFEQQKIYQDSLRDNGQEFTALYVALPGHSEHQTGLAVDLGLRQSDINFICPAFPYDGICQRFRELAPSYGFIERYPAGKESVTGISHEPWHFRYVGTPHAECITRRGLTLEEYLL